MGGKGRSITVNQPSVNTPNTTPSEYEKQLASMAQEYYDQTNPLRRLYAADFEKFLRPYGTGTSAETIRTGDSYNPYNLPAFAPLYQLARSGVESQYNNARQNIMGSTPRGGALINQLANLENQRAQQAGSLPATVASPIIQNLYNTGLGYASGAVPVALAGVGAANQGYRSSYNTELAGNYQLAGQQMQAQAAADLAAMNAANSESAGLGRGLGSLMGMGLKGLGGKGLGKKGTASAGSTAMGQALGSLGGLSGLSSMMFIPS